MTTTPATPRSPEAPTTTGQARQLLRHSRIFANRSLAKSARNPGALVNGVLTPTIFLVIFVYLFGGAVAGSSEDYLQYLFPGIVVMGAGVSGLLASGLTINIDLKNGIFDRFRSLPIARAAPLLGSILADVVRYIIAVALLFAIGFAMGFRVETNLTSALTAGALAILFGFSLSWTTVFLGALAKDENTVMAVTFIGFLPLLLGTSLAAPIDTLPGWLRTWANINPVTHAMDAARALLTGATAAGSITLTLLWSAILIAVFCPLAILAYAREQ
jgi:oleandomycin transport system permease protein